jgi:hypothetical protein
MSSGYTTFRSELVTALSAAAAFSSFEWHAGPPPSGDGAIPNTTQLGYVWIVRSDEDQANKLLREITAGVRIYLDLETRIDPLTPDDPTPLEQARPISRRRSRRSNTALTRGISTSSRSSSITIAVPRGDRARHRWNDSAVS